MGRTLAVGAATLTIAAALALGGCGSSDDSSSEEGLTKDEVIAKADDICTSYNNQFKEKVKDIPADASDAEATKFVSTVAVPLYKEELTDLQAIDPDPSVAAEWDALTSALGSDLAAVEADPRLALSTDTAFPNATRLAKKFGLKVCGAS